MHSKEGGTIYCDRVWTLHRSLEFEIYLYSNEIEYKITMMATVKQGLWLYNHLLFLKSECSCECFKEQMKIKYENHVKSVIRGVEKWEIESHVSRSTRETI